jgi:hypothetical protein
MEHSSGIGRELCAIAPNQLPQRRTTVHNNISKLAISFKVTVMQKIVRGKIVLTKAYTTKDINPQYLQKKISSPQ